MFPLLWFVFMPCLWIMCENKQLSVCCQLGNTCYWTDVAFVWNAFMFMTLLQNNPRIRNLFGQGKIKLGNDENFRTRTGTSDGSVPVGAVASFLLRGVWSSMWFIHEGTVTINNCVQNKWLLFKPWKVTTISLDRKE